MNFAEWLKSVPADVTDDVLWRIEAYRLSLFASDLGWFDVTKLSGDRRTRSLSDQLYRALGSISGNIEEGYSRGTGKDRARFYEYALGSAREARGWYYRGRHVLTPSVTLYRMRLITQVIRLLTTMVPDQRGSYLHEMEIQYRAIEPGELIDVRTDDLEPLLAGCPMP